MRQSVHRQLVAAVCFLVCASPALAQGYSRAVTESYRVLPNVTYLKIGTWEGKLDIYSRWRWVGNPPNPLEVARSLSPLPLRRSELPGVISIHGDADPTVPYTQSVRLYHALRAAGATQELITVPGGKPGGFSRDENRRPFAAIEAFVTRLGIEAR